MLALSPMETIIGFLPYIQVILSVVLIIAVLMQRSESGLGGVFGGSDASSTFSTRRGFEKTLFNATIAIAIIFVLTTFISLLLG